MAHKYRVGLDLGTNSLGWCAVELDADGNPCGVLDAGVRILTPNEEAGRDPQSKNSLAAGRRDARATRRRRDRFLARQKRLMTLLVHHGLMPAETTDRKELEALDPYWLRAAALDECLKLYEIGRAIFHLNQRRGFKSNRLAESTEEGAIEAGMKQLRERLEESGARTLGELLARWHGCDKYGHRKSAGAGYVMPAPVRFRPTSKGNKNQYDFYPSRAMIEDELKLIWARQAKAHPELTDELLEKLRYVIIGQRDLKKPPVGRCTLRPEEDWRSPHGVRVDLGERTPKAHPLFQRFRILQDICQLRVTRPGAGKRPITMQERDAIANKLMSVAKSTISFEEMRKAAKLRDDARFNYELEGRHGFKPDETAAKLAAGKCFGKGWRSLSRHRQIEVVERLVKDEDPGELIAWLTSEFDLDATRAEAISKTRLPQGHGNFGRSVLADLVEVMEKQSPVDKETGEIVDQPLTYNEAVAAIDHHHSDLRPERREARLPYYGKVMIRHVIANHNAPEGSQAHIGRVPNPTVHIALNQLRAVVNALIDAYGTPSEIAVELARELKLNQQRKKEMQAKNRENERKNEARKAKLESLGIADTHDARLRLRLYEELPPDHRVCVFTGENIGSCKNLFNGSIEIEHILPYSKTLDDSFMNKVLCTREANRRKANRPPAAAWSGEALQEIVDRAERLFPTKAWRFQPDAMSKFGDEAGFRESQLHDTKHMARLAKGYLDHICDQVWAPPGRLTAMLRAKWGFNRGMLPDDNYAATGQKKNRKDHRHHAIDAFVVACTSRSLLNRMAHASARAEVLDIDRLFPRGEFPEPFEGYRDALREKLDSMVVSHKPDHGLAPASKRKGGSTSGKLHAATAYGAVDEKIGGKRFNLVTRKSIRDLEEGDIGRVRDVRLREKLEARAYEAKRDRIELKEALATFVQDREREGRPIRRVRIVETRQDEYTRVVRHGKDGQFVKTYILGDNHCLDIFETADGSWDGQAVTVFDANQAGFRPEWLSREPTPRHLMRLHKGDLLEADFGEGRGIFRVVRLEPSARRVRLVSHRDAGNYEQRHKDPQDPFRWNLAGYKRLRDAGARLVRVDPIGRISPVEAKR